MVKNKQEKLRFIAVGTTNTLIDFGLLFILKFIGFPLIPANIISTTTAFVFSFFANKKFTFQGGSNNIGREIALFIVITLFGLWVIQSVVISLLSPFISEMIGSATVGVFIAKLFATVVTLVWNYILYSRVVFAHKES